MSLHNNLHMLKHNFSRVFKKLLARFNVFRIYYHAGQYMAFERGVYFVPSESRVVSGIHLYEMSTTESFKFLSHAIWTINDCLTPIGNRGRLMLLCSSNDSKSLHRCSHAKNSFRVFNWAACSTRYAPFAPYYNILLFTVFSFKKLRKCKFLSLFCIFDKTFTTSCITVCKYDTCYTHYLIKKSLQSERE